MIVYTALGDSVTAGESVSSPKLAYPSLIVSTLRKQSRKVRGQVLAQPGWTSKALETAVFENSPLPLEQSTSINILVGGDDLAYAALAVLRGAPLKALQDSLLIYKQEISTLVRAIKRISKARIILCTQYNPFPNSPIAVDGIQALNLATETAAAELGVTLALVHEWFAGNQAALISGYRTGRVEDALSGQLPIHPNNKGHQVLANGLLTLIV